MNPHRGSDLNEFLIEEGIMTPTPTPRTDAIAHRGLGSVAYIAEMTSFARQLERENQTFRNAQKACEDCDAPRVDRIAELERELAAAKDGWTDEICKAQADMRRAEKDINEMRAAYLAERALADRLAASLKESMERLGVCAGHRKTLAAWKEARK